MEPSGCRSNYWLNTVFTANKGNQAALLKTANEAGVMARPIWQLMPELDMYRNCQTGPLDNARWFQQRAVNLPSSARSHE